MNKFTSPVSKRDFYQAPCIVSIEVATEKGFAESGDYNNVGLPDYSIVDETEW